MKFSKDNDIRFLQIVLFSFAFFSSIIFVKNTFIESNAESNAKQWIYEREYIDKDKKLCKKREYKREVDETYFEETEKRQYIKCINNEIFKIGFNEVENSKILTEILKKCY